MKYYVEHIKDINGSNYLAIRIDKLEVLPFLMRLEPGSSWLSMTFTSRWDSIRKMCLEFQRTK